MKSLGVAVASFMDLIRQPVYIILFLICSVLLLTSNWMTQFGFGREQQMIRESGVAGPVLAGLLIIFLTVPGTIGEEIRTRQILTVLSKPISRVSLIFGRFGGVFLALLLAYCGFALVFSLSLRWSEGSVPVRSMLTASYLGFLQTAIMAAITLLFSILLPIPLTVVASFIMFTGGNLLSFISKQMENWSAVAKGVGEFVLLLFPDFVRLNASYDFAVGRTASLAYLGLATLYAAVYIAFVIALGGWVLSRREIA